MSKELGSFRRTRAAADSSMLTEIRRRAVESQNYAAQRFLKPLFSPQSPVSLTSGNAALFTQNRLTNPAYGTPTTTSNVTPEEVPGGRISDFAVTPAGPGTADLYSIDVDSDGNIYAIALGGGSTILDTNIYQYNGNVGGVMTKSVWGVIPKANFLANNSTVLVKYSPAGIPLWATVVTASTYFYPNSAKVDAAGNLYVYGFAGGENVIFRNYTSGGGSGSTVTLTTGASTGGSPNTLDENDLFVYKYSSSGTFLWCATVKSTGGTSESASVGTSFSVDSAGNCYHIFNITSSTATYTFRSFSSVVSGVVAYSSFGVDNTPVGFRGFVCKLNSDGVYQWVSRLTRENLATGSFFNAPAIAADWSGSLVVAGIQVVGVGLAVESFSNVSGGTIRYGTKNSISAGTLGTDAYIVAFNSNGQASWVTRNRDGVGSNTTATQSIHVRSNVVSAAGTYQGANVLFSSANTYGGGTITITPYGTLSLGLSGASAWIARYNSSGTCLGATNVTANLPSASINQQIQDLSGNIYVAIGTADVSTDAIAINSLVSAAGNGSAISTSLYGTTQAVKFNDIILAKYNPSLEVQWVTRLESGSGSSGSSESIRSLAVHPTSNFVYVGGFVVSVSTAVLNLTNASGVSGGVIQYATGATLSTAFTGAGSSSRSAFIAKYTM